MPALNRVCGWRMSSIKSHTTCVTVATSRNSFPGPGHPENNFDKVAAISDKIETNHNRKWEPSKRLMAAISDKIETNHN